MSRRYRRSASHFATTVALALAAILSMPAAHAAAVTINVSTLSAGAGGNGWEYDADEAAVLITGASNDYRLMGTAPSGVSVFVGAEVDGLLVLENLSLNNAGAGTGYPALEIMRPHSGVAGVVQCRGTVSLAGAGEGLCLGFAGGSSRTFNIILSDGASLDIRGGAGRDGIYCALPLVIHGTGTANVTGGDSADAPAGRGIAVHNPLAILRDVRVTARGGDYTGDSQADSGGNDGVFCSFTLLVGDHAKLDAIGGSSLGAGCQGGNGVFMENYYPTRQGTIEVTSDAPGALTCTGGVGRVVNDQHGNGITANLSPLTLDGTGEIKAVGDHGIAAFSNIGITGGKITAEGQDAGYGLYAGYGGSSEWVDLIGGAITAFNRDTANHAYHKFLNQSGGTLNTTPPGGGGGGGGGAPTVPALALLAALLAQRKNGVCFNTGAKRALASRRA